MADYPDFREIQKEDRSLFEAEFNNNPPKISEFTFTNLYSWRDAYKFKFSFLGGLIILRSDSESEIRFFEPIGKGDKRAAIEKVLNDYKCVFIRLPEETKALFTGGARFRVDLDMDNADYLYEAAELVKLQGRKYDGKRNLIKKFESSYSYEYVKMDGANARESLNFEEKWCSIKNCDNIMGLSKERIAIREMAGNFSEFGLRGGAIKIQGNFSALAIAQKLNPGTLVMHVLKADPNINGLYQAMLHEFLSKEAEGFAYVNLEQDLGREGLRKSKQSYHPVKMIKKYTLQLAD